MEDENKIEEIVEESEETSPETQEEETETEAETEEETTEEAKEEVEEGDGYKKQLEKLEDKKPKSELEKAKKALHFNAERLKELGGDPTEVLAPKAPKQEQTDVESVVERKLAERDVRALAKTDDEYKLIMFYVDNNGLSVDEAHLLANKGKILNQAGELKRANVKFGTASASGRKVDQDTIPKRSDEEVKLLERRNMKFNPKTKTYQGKFYEEYYDTTEKAWVSRKLQK